MNCHNHEILVVKKHESGAEEWFCPTCGRRFIVQWTPQYQCIVLSSGDEAAIHNIGRGALVVLNHEVPLDDSSLDPFHAWLRGIDLGDALDQDLN